MLSIEDARTIFLNHLNSLTINPEPRELYDPIRYSLSFGGKRIRPVLALMTGSIFSDDYQAVIPAALALEIFHNFTLLHDDIMDNSALRRNKPTVHMKWNTSTAILSGDAMLILAFQIIQKSSQSSLPLIMELFSQTAMRVCEGQQFDMEFEKRMDVSEQEYIKMIELKTAVLFGASMKMGAIISDASDKDSNLLYEAGKNLGIAFQLKDDLLDTYGNSATFGKRIGGDILENKKTYLFICARDHAGNTERNELLRLYTTYTGNEEQKIETVRSLYNKIEVQHYAKAKIEEYMKLAFSCCEQLTSSAKIKKELVNLFDYLISREN
jgi:geranylgeranyl diphosphate synthase, type II